MNTSRRLFDSVSYQLKQFPKQDMLVAKEKGVWKPYSTEEVQRTVNHFSAGLSILGVSGNDFTIENADKIAIISNNRPEWIFTDIAVQQTGAVLVPIYPTTNPLELQFILNDATVKYVFVSNQEMLDKVNSIRSQVPSIQNIYSFDQLGGADHWSKICEMATEESVKHIESVKENISEDHVA